MPLRPPAGFIRPGYDPLENPDAPTGVVATGGDASASVAFTPPANVGGSAISEFYAVSNPDQITEEGASSPINVTGLTNGTPYTFTVWALNTYGPGPYSAASGSVTPAQPQFGLFAGGTPPATNVIDRINIATLGNAADFGDLTTAIFSLASCSSSTRSVFAGGRTSGTRLLEITFSNFSSGGSVSSFGNLPSTLSTQLSGFGNSTRGIFGPGQDDSGADGNVINFITIATTGNSTDFGDALSATGGAAGTANSTRGIFSKGGTNTLEFVTIASAGNSTNFGDLTRAVVGNARVSAASSSTLALFAGTRQSFNNTIDFVTISSAGNATDFGDLTVGRNNLAGTSNKTRAVFGGGFQDTARNIIDFVTIASAGNATDFGDLTLARDNLAACSDSHGGL